MAVGEIGHRVELLGRDVARRDAMLLERQQYAGVALRLVRTHVAPDPVGEGLVRGEMCRVGLVVGRLGGELRVVEAAADAVDLGLGQGGRAILQVGELGLDLARELFHAEGLDQYLDARLVRVVTAPVQVVHAQHGFAVVENLLPGHEARYFLADDRRPSEAASDQHPKADVAPRGADEIQADVMGANDRPILLGAVDRDLELARQIRELGVEGAPLAHDLAPRTRIDVLVAGHAGKWVGGDVADAVAGSLDRVKSGSRASARSKASRGCPERLRAWAS